MTPAQLGCLIDVHNELHAPSDGKHARTSSREYDNPAALVGLSQMRVG